MSTCLSDSDLDRYHAGEMDAAEAERIREHLAACKACGARDAGLLAKHEHLLHRVRALGRTVNIDADKRAGNSSEPSLSAGGSARDGLQTGDRVGPYKLLELLGEGGFGVVYLAEQQEPIRRRVALKIIKLGMDTKEVVARFEAERQALAMMDHPNVAKVLDAGATEQGRPYFVMELVQGVPITDYCDRLKLETGERLELFARVCEAVQHAHQKGIIHRDLKPTNVLVAVLDDRPVPKVIDFGVAKAISHRLAAQTVYTEQGQFIGTPEYMSPEQAEMSGLNVDTRTDIYSMGILLYQLLAGALPFDSKTLREAGYAEIQRIIREEEAPKPSTRLSRLGKGESVAIAMKRRTDAPSLIGQLRGDLDWITMKAVEKDRTRRYGTASELAADIRRHLNHEVVLASPPSARYRAKKFVRRHRLGVAAGVAIAVTLATATGVSIAFGLREAAARERERAALALADARAEEAGRQAQAAEAARQLAETRADETKRVAEFQSQMLSGINIEAMGRGFRQVFREQVQAGLEREYVVDGQGYHRRTSEEIAQELVKFDEQAAAAEATDVARRVMDEYVLRPAAEAIEKQFGGQPLVQAQLREAVGMAYWALGQFNAAEPHLRAALELNRRELGSDDLRVATSLASLSMVLADKGDYAAAEPLRRESLAIHRKLLGAEHQDVATCLGNLATLLKNKGDYAGAEPLYREALAIRRKLLGDEHPDVALLLNQLACLLQDEGDFAGAEPLYREALALRCRLLGDEHPDVAVSLNNLATLLKDRGDYTGAEPLYREALAILRKTHGQEHPMVATVLNNLAVSLKRKGDYAGAEHLYRQVLALRRKLLGDQHPDVARSLNYLGTLLVDQGDYAGAEPLYREALAILRKTHGQEHPMVATVLNNLAVSLKRKGDYGGAESLYREALAMRRKLLGDQHRDVTLSLTGLADLLDIQGDYAGAEPLYREALAILRRAHGDQHVDVASSLRNLAALLGHQGNYAGAEPLYREALTIYEKALPPGHENTITTRIRLGTVLLENARDPDQPQESRIARFGEAEKLLLSAYDALSVSPKAPADRMQQLLSSLIKLYEARDLFEPGMGHGSKAEEWRARLAEASATSRPAEPDNKPQ